jgi:hypothetical protein
VTEPTDDRSGSPWASPRFLVAAGIVALIAVFGAVLVFTGGDESPPAAAGPEPTSTSASTVSASAPTTKGDDAGDCDLPAGDQTLPVITPQDTEWELVGTVAVPTAPDSIGPAVVDAQTGLRSCFAASPLGALYAAVNYLAALSDPDQVPGALQTLSADSPGRDALLELLVSDSAALAVDPDSRVQVAGFTVLNYAADRTTISLAVRASNGGTGSLPITLIRSDGDWKVVPPPDGNISAAVDQLPSLAGYVAWSGA